MSKRKNHGQDKSHKPQRKRQRQQKRGGKADESAYRNEEYAGLRIAIDQGKWTRMIERNICPFFNLRKCNKSAKECEKDHTYCKQWLDECREKAAKEGDAMKAFLTAMESDLKSAGVRSLDKGDKASYDAQGNAEVNLRSSDDEEEEEESHEDEKEHLSSEASELRAYNKQISEVEAKMAQAGQEKNTAALVTLAKQLDALRKKQAEVEARRDAQAEAARKREESDRHERSAFQRDRGCEWYKHRFTIIAPGSLGVWPPARTDKYGGPLNADIRKHAKLVIDYMVESLGVQFAKHAFGTHLSPEKITEKISQAMNLDMGVHASVRAQQKLSALEYWNRSGFKCGHCSLPIHSPKCQTPVF